MLLFIYLILFAFHEPIVTGRFIVPNTSGTGEAMHSYTRSKAVRGLGSSGIKMFHHTVCLYNIIATQWGED